MNLKKFILSSLLLVIGLILHQIAPPLLMGMKPDFLLTMMFIAIMLCNDYKLATIIGITSGLLTAATTTFPGGQIANIIDKLITCQIVFLLNKILGEKTNESIKMLIIAAMGTLVSGFAFLTAALFTVGLPTSYKALTFTVVLPATIVNTIVSIIVYKGVALALKHSRLTL
ncbi:MAG TPA: tryptophan transporter [Clostridiales bacterium]|nr:tryptophan transporter [Clostridiales bacterium]